MEGGEKGCDVEEGGNNYHTCVNGQTNQQSIEKQYC